MSNTAKEGAPVEIDRRSIKKMFPHLAEELEGKENKVSIDGVRANAAEAEETVTDPDETLLAQAEAAKPDLFRHYNPSVVDFIRRCDTNAQAEEIVVYLQKRGELTKEQAGEILAQLKREGLRSFGCKKEDGYYFKQSGLC